MGPGSDALPPELDPREENPAPPPPAATAMYVVGTPAPTTQYAEAAAPPAAPALVDPAAPATPPWKAVANAEENIGNVTEKTAEEPPLPPR